jgi:hypothetical protein
MSTNLDVQHCIQSYLNDAKGGTAHDKVHSAWESIQLFRLSTCGYDQYVVAAEHYLWMRDVSGSSPHVYLLTVPFFTAGIPLYDIYKMIFKKIGVGTYHESDCPPSDPSAWVRAWSYTGLCDGARDPDITNASLVAPAEPNWYGRALVWRYGDPGT